MKYSSHQHASNMFDELIKYKERGTFLFKLNSSLSAVCNAPRNYSGIYLIFAIKHEQSSLIYIGISGRKSKDGGIIHRKDGLRGRFLTGKTDGVLRKVAWKNRMTAQNIPELEIRWYVTYGQYHRDIPRDLEVKLLTEYLVVFGKLPKWNNRI